MRKLEDLTPIELYSNNNQLNIRDVIGLGLMGKLDIFYLFDAPSLVIYEPESEQQAALGTKNNMVADDGCVEIEYLPGDLLPVTKRPLNLLYTNSQTELINLVKGNTPDGFKFGRMLDGSKRIVDAGKVFIDPATLRQQPLPPEPQQAQELASRPTKTSLKTVGLLMMHLAKSPKYASGNAPNKSQIKELLLDLATEYGIKEYGLAKVDERLLTDAMEYLETQKN
jgi:hypothetical protein